MECDEHNQNDTVGCFVLRGPLVSKTVINHSAKKHELMALGLSSMPRSCCIVEFFLLNYCLIKYNFHLFESITTKFVIIFNLKRDIYIYFHELYNGDDD